LSESLETWPKGGKSHHEGGANVPEEGKTREEKRPTLSSASVPRALASGWRDSILKSCSQNHLKLGQKQALTMVMLLAKCYGAGKIGVRRKRGGFDGPRKGGFPRFSAQVPENPSPWIPPREVSKKPDANTTTNPVIKVQSSETCN
jgi:hypothetical protein